MTSRDPVRRFVNPLLYRPSFMTTQGQNAGTYYTSGHYDFPTTDSNLSQASPTQTHGVANHPHAAHAAIIASGAGSASGGAGAVIIEVSGTSIDESGTRTPADTEIIVSDITTMSVDDYFETTKKWLGTVTFTLKNASGATQTTFSAVFNYGLCKYTDMSDQDFRIKSFGVDGLARANDSGFNVRLLKHSSAGWTYAATGFVAGNGELVNLNDDYVTEVDLSSGENFAYDRSNLDELIVGSGTEGYIVEVTVGSNNSIEYMNAIIGFKYI